MRHDVSPHMTMMTRLVTVDVFSSGLDVVHDYDLTPVRVVPLKSSTERQGPSDTELTRYLSKRGQGRDRTSKETTPLTSEKTPTRYVSLLSSRTDVGEGRRYPKSIGVKSVMSRLWRGHPSPQRFGRGP